MAVRSAFEFFNAEPSLAVLLLLMALAISLKGMLLFGHKVIAASIRRDIQRKLQVRLATLMGEMSHSHFTRTAAGSLNNIVVREVPLFLQGFMELTRLPVTALYVVIYTVIAGLLRPGLTVVLLFSGVCVVIAMRALIRRAREYSHRTTKEAGNLQALLIEYIQNLAYLKATASTALVIKHLRDKIHSFSKWDMRQSVLAAFVSSIKEPIAVVFLVVLLFYQVEVEGQSINEVLVLCFLLYRIVNQLLQLQANWQRFNGVIGGITAVDNAINTLETEREYQGERILTSVLQDINLNDVAVSYGDETVIDSINLKIRARETLALVGPSGAGKTTLFHLITGLISPDKGDITIGGIDYKELEKSSLRNKIGYVTQDPVIINDTVGNNIAFWECQPDDKVCSERIVKAMNEANCSEFAGDLTRWMGERGVQLSGGQKQRIAIARELFREPDLLIFDEATSALDSASEAVIQESIAKLKGKRTVVLIAHRLATVRNVDRIIVLDKGKIMEEGSFDELVDNHGLFYELCARQNLLSTDDVNNEGALNGQ
jgi:ABC-type multidrug transport system fused ATPase/permease subunit